jgi:hypothetical protein
LTSKIETDPLGLEEREVNCKKSTGYGGKSAMQIQPHHGDQTHFLFNISVQKLDNPSPEIFDNEWKSRDYQAS